MHHAAQQLHSAAQGVFSATQALHSATQGIHIFTGASFCYAGGVFCYTGASFCGQSGMLAAVAHLEDYIYLVLIYWRESWKILYNYFYMFIKTKYAMDLPQPRRDVYKNMYHIWIYAGDLESLQFQDSDDLEYLQMQNGLQYFRNHIFYSLHVDANALTKKHPQVDPKQKTTRLISTLTCWRNQNPTPSLLPPARGSTGTHVYIYIYVCTQKC